MNSDRGRAQRRPVTNIDYSWVVILTTMIGSIASIALLIAAGIYFPYLLPNLGWPAVLVFGTAIFPSMILLPSAGSSPQGNIGGFAVLFGVFGLMVTVGFIALASPATMLGASWFASNVVFAVVGGFLSFVGGATIAGSLEQNAKRDIQQNQSAPAAEEKANDRSSTSARVQRQLPATRLEAKSEQSPQQQRVTTPTAPPQSPQPRRFSLSSSTPPLETGVEKPEATDGSAHTSKKRKLT
jgi:hypothetical protein